MSNKSLFEKLFEDVMEHDALGIPNEAAEGDSDLENMGGGDEGGMEEEGGGMVTLTLDASVAEALLNALQEAMGGEEEAPEMEGELGQGEAPPEGEASESWSEDAEDEDSESEDSESEDSEYEEGEEEEDDKKVKTESPQAQYKPFTNKGEVMTKKGNNKVGGVAGSSTGLGKATGTAQTAGTAHYMPMNTNYDDGKSNKVKTSRTSTPSGPGKSMFN
jgi:hypothetical protein